MALHNPSGLYQGTPGLNPLPYVQYEMQARQRKAAKDDAIDKYYQNLPNTINEAGVRDQEVPILHAAKDKLSQYYMENSNAIKKGNTPEAFNMGKLFRDAQGVVDRSKNRSATSLNIAKLRGNPKYDYIFKDPKLIEKIAAHDAAIDTPGSEAIDFNQLTLPPPPFDPVKHIAGIKVKPNPDTPVYQDIPGDKYNRLEITPKKFSPEDLNAVHIYSQSQLENNPSFENQIKEKVQKDPALSANLASVFEQNYKHPIMSEGDLATAYTLSLMDLTPTQKTIPNKELIDKDKNSEWDRRQKEREAFARAMQGDRQAFQAKYKGKTTEELTKMVDGYIQGEIDDAVKNAKEVPSVPGLNVGSDKIYKINADPQELAAFKQKDENTGKEYTPTGIIVRPEKNEFILLGAAKDGGNVTISRPTYTAAIVKTKFPSKAEQNQIVGAPTVTTKKTTSEYSNIRETNKGTIGIKNGKWHDIKTGKPIQ